MLSKLRVFKLQEACRLILDFNVIIIYKKLTNGEIYEG
jgi:hypothetical protein